MSDIASIAQNQRGEVVEADVTPALSTGGGTVGEGYPAARVGAQVRRLTPTERERLMGAPDGWTYDVGPSLADASNSYPTEDHCVVDRLPDGRRESAAGDGVAVPCAQWIGERLMGHGV
jgi:DNA (cytosine-5)-methyltransferase 1